MDPNQGQVVATAWEWVHGEGPTDNVFTSQALTYLLKDGGYRVDASGGRLFEFTVEYQENSTFGFISEMETLDTNRIDVFDCARYEQKIQAGTVVFSDLEELRNAVENRKIDVIKSKLKNGTNSAMEQLERTLFGDGTGNGGKNPNGLQNIMPNDPTTGSVGTINRATFAFWRSRTADGTKVTTQFDQLRAEMTEVFNDCSLGGTEKVPTGVISDQLTFQGYESLLVEIERLVKDSGGEAEADIAWLNQAIRFKGKPYVYSEQAPAEKAFFINKNFLKLTVLKGGWMKMKPPVEPGNQLVRVHRVFSVLNLCASASRHLGVVYNTGQ